MILTDPREELKHHLNQNEKLLWTGQPKSGIIFRVSDLFMIPFSLVWCGFSIFWVIMAARASFFFALFGLPFVGVGIMFVFGRFIFDMRQRANTIYGLTENRIIIMSGKTTKRINSLNITALSHIEYSEKVDGSGTIIIGQTVPMLGNSMGWMPGNKLTPSLEMIPEVKRVYNMIVDLQRKVKDVQ